MSCFSSFFFFLLAALLDTAADAALSAQGLVEGLAATNPSIPNPMILWIDLACPSSHGCRRRSSGLEPRRCFPAAGV
jgi:hypothetical protein